ncbi:MAG: DUF1848 domain-containing protein [Lachnospiraceae bacterium]|nr:DUF1848 domain-containing protein [Lachnospiraceae bacterium]
MILNTGSRTDIPAYYSEWFYNRIREGYVMTRNPYDPVQVTRYRLSPDVVDVIAFCTKNPEPMLDRMAELERFRQYWFVTITPYGTEIEPNVPDKHTVMESFLRLSEQVGIRAVCWRYDPIFITEKYSLGYHMEAFEKMAEKLSGYTESCIISFIDLYVKTKKNFPEARSVTREEQEILAESFVRLGQRYGIQIRSCCEGTGLQKFGVDPSGCMTQQVLERAIGYSLDVPKGVKPAREGCACLLGNDIGMYNTCGHGCRYCYANYDMETVRKNRKLHDPASPLLIGRLQKEDRVRDARQESYCSGQMMLEW